MGLLYVVNLHVQPEPQMSLHDAHVVSGKVKGAIRSAMPEVNAVLVHREPYELGLIQCYCEAAVSRIQAACPFIAPHWSSTALGSLYGVSTAQLPDHLLRLLQLTAVFRRAPYGFCRLRASAHSHS